MSPAHRIRLLARTSPSLTALALVTVAACGPAAPADDAPVATTAAAAPAAAPAALPDLPPELEAVRTALDRFRDPYAALRER